MVIRLSVQRLKTLLDTGRQRLTTLAWSAPHEAIRDRALGVLAEGYELLDQHITDTREESHEAAEARDALDAAEARSVDAFETMYKVLRISQIEAELDDEAVHKDHMVALERFLQGTSPSSFRAAPVGDKLNILHGGLQMRERFLDPTKRGQKAAKRGAEVLASFQASWKRWLQETAEARAAHDELDAAFGVATRHYRSARALIKSVLILTEQEDLLAELLPPLRSIYGRRSAGSASDSAPSDDASTDVPSEAPRTDDAPSEAPRTDD